jgi:hypothetical protein
MLPLEPVLPRVSSLMVVFMRTVGEHFPNTTHQGISPTCGPRAVVQAQQCWPPMMGLGEGGLQHHSASTVS